MERFAANRKYVTICYDKILVWKYGEIERTLASGTIQRKGYRFYIFLIKYRILRESNLRAIYPALIIKSLKNSYIPAGISFDRDSGNSRLSGSASDRAA